MFIIALISYLSILQNTPKGDHKAGEIEIISDPQEITIVEELQKKRLLKNHSESEATTFSRVGVFVEDQYLIGVRDAVIFPSGAKGTYDRIVWKSALSGPGGVVVVPVFPDGRIALNLNYRHATRSWEFELPRGLVKEGETLETAALRELQEETGLTSNRPTYLGSMTPDTGILSSSIPIYIGKIRHEGLSDQEYSEAIEGIYLFTKEELKKGLKQGFLDIPGKGKIPFRDSFTAFAMLIIE